MPFPTQGVPLRRDPGAAGCFTARAALRMDRQPLNAKLVLVAAGAGAAGTTAVWEPGADRVLGHATNPAAGPDRMLLYVMDWGVPNSGERRVDVCGRVVGWWGR